MDNLEEKEKKAIIIKVVICIAILVAVMIIGIVM